MSIYVSTFISGLQEPVKEFLCQDLHGVKILDLYDGLVVYKAGVPVQRILQLKFFNNSFLLLKKYSDLKDRGLEWMMADVIGRKEPFKKLAEYRLPPGIRSFRIITSSENRLSPVSKDLLRQMEQQIERAAGLRSNRAKGDLEFWFLARREKVGFFMLRLTRHASHEKVLQRGELRPELCHILCRLSEPKAGDIFLDPFCGTGAIPLERARMGPFQWIFMSDKKEEMVRLSKARVKELGQKARGKIIVRRADALSLSAFEDGFIEKIVTDPPWGLYEEMKTDIGLFYEEMIKELSRVLKPGGIMVLLTARKEALERALENSDCRLLGKLDILVSGKKAAIYKLQKEK